MTEEYGQLLAERGTSTSVADTAAEPAVQRISQDGHVQLLVDLRFLQDVCSGGRSHALHGTSLSEVESSASAGSTTGDQEAPSPATAASVAELPALCQQVQAAIDPFDLDVYEPFLKKARAVMYNCSAVLLGHFTALQPQHTQVRA